MKYYWIHATIAIVVQAIFAGILYGMHAPLDAAVFGGGAVGSAVYISREIRDAEKLGYWDVKGLVYPVVSCIVIYLLSLVIG